MWTNWANENSFIFRNYGVRTYLQSTPNSGYKLSKVYILHLKATIKPNIQSTSVFSRSRWILNLTDRCTFIMPPIITFTSAISTYFRRGKKLPENPAVPKTMVLNHESVCESKLDHQCKSPKNYNQSVIQLACFNWLTGHYFNQVQVCFQFRYLSNQSCTIFHFH